MGIEYFGGWPSIRGSSEPKAVGVSLLGGTVAETISETDLEFGLWILPGIRKSFESQSLASVLVCGDVGIYLALGFTEAHPLLGTETKVYPLPLFTPNEGCCLLPKFGRGMTWVICIYPAYESFLISVLCQSAILSHLDYIALVKIFLFMDSFLNLCFC